MDSETLGQATVSSGVTVHVQPELKKNVSICADVRLYAVMMFVNHESSGLLEITLEMRFSVCCYHYSLSLSSIYPQVPQATYSAGSATPPPSVGVLPRPPPGIFISLGVLSAQPMHEVYEAITTLFRICDKIVQVRIYGSTTLLTIVLLYYCISYKQLVSSNCACNLGKRLQMNHGIEPLGGKTGGW